MDVSTGARFKPSPVRRAAGGLRNPNSFWDLYDVWTRPNPVGQPNLWTRDRAVNVPGDILGVASRFGASRPRGAPDEASAARRAFEVCAQDAGPGLS